MKSLEYLNLNHINLVSLLLCIISVVKYHQNSDTFWLMKKQLQNEFFNRLPTFLAVACVVIRYIVDFLGTFLVFFKFWLLLCRIQWQGLVFFAVVNFWKLTIVASFWRLWLGNKVSNNLTWASFFYISRSYKWLGWWFVRPADTRIVFITLNIHIIGSGY